MPDDTEASVVPSYVNKKRKTISLFVTPHAREQFVKRWRLLSSEVAFRDGIDKALVLQFSRAKRITKLSRMYRKRMNKHGQDTLYFVNGTFCFVVKDAAIVTIELCRKSDRFLNKAVKKRTVKI